MDGREAELPLRRVLQRPIRGHRALAASLPSRSSLFHCRLGFFPILIRQHPLLEKGEEEKKKKGREAQEAGRRRSRPCRGCLREVAAVKPGVRPWVPTEE
jgi:hypothetical protein